jgi:hypothetical protein
MPSLTLTTGNFRRLCVRAAAATRKWPAFLALEFALACGAAQANAPVAPATKEPATPASGSGAFDRAWGERDLRRVPARVMLPDALAWHATTSGTFTLLEHHASHSTLLLRVTLAPRLVRPAECEADVRLARPTLPADDPSSVIERRTLAAPAGFDVRLVVGVVPAPGGVRGYALAIGAATSRCYIAAFETESTGAHAADRVAERLAVIVSGVLETMRVASPALDITPPVGVK